MNTSGRGNYMEGLAHCNSLSSRKYGWPSGPRHIIWDHLWIPYSHSGASFPSRRVACDKDCVSQEQPSSSRSIGILVAMEVDIWLPDQISGPPTRWRSAISKGAMLRATMDGQRGVRPLREWKAISNGQYRNLFEVRLREARAVVPRGPSSSRSYVQ